MPESAKFWSKKKKKTAFERPTEPGNRRERYYLFTEKEYLLLQKAR
jgi:hypothetical protein